MQKRIPAVFIALLASCIVSSSTGQSQSADPWIGTWKTNLEKSTYSPGPKPTTATTIKIEPSADGIKTTFDGMTAEGKPFHTEAVGAFDGKDNPVKGAHCCRIPPWPTSASTAERMKRRPRSMASRRPRLGYRSRPTARPRPPPSPAKTLREKRSTTLSCKTNSNEETVTTARSPRSSTASRLKRSTCSVDPCVQLWADAITTTNGVFALNLLS